MGKIVIYSQHNHVATIIAETIAGSAETIFCDSAEDVVRQCFKHRPDLVIIVAIAPFLNGSHLIQRIRLGQEHKPAIYVIAWHQSEHIVLGLLECGVDQYMTLPVCMGRLRNKLHNHITSSQKQ